MSPGQPHITRRHFLRNLAGGAAVVAVGGATWRAIDQGVFSTGDGPAYAAWGEWDDRSGGFLALVRPAVLAANAHNTQPWLFELGTDRIDLFADTTRSMGAMDPLRREMYVSVGCALENLMLAAQAEGLRPAVTLLPDPSDETHVAQVGLGTGGREESPLYHAIPNRHTDRGAYDTSRPVERATLDRLASLNDVVDLRVAWITDEAGKRRFGEYTIEATVAIANDPEMAADSYAWMRQDWDQIQREKDGLTVDASGLSDIVRALGKLLPAQSQKKIDSSWVGATRTRTVATASAFGIVAARDRGDDRQRLEAGRLWQRLHLAATDAGLSMQPLAQTVERADRELSANLKPVFTNALAELTPEWQAVLPFRVGYPTGEPALSPRRPAEEVTRS